MWVGGRKALTWVLGGTSSFLRGKNHQFRLELSTMEKCLKGEVHDGKLAQLCLTVQMAAELRGRLGRVERWRDNRRSSSAQFRMSLLFPSLQQVVREGQERRSQPSFFFDINGRNCTPLSRRTEEEWSAPKFDWSKSQGEREGGREPGSCNDTVGVLSRRPSGAEKDRENRRKRTLTLKSGEERNTNSPIAKEERECVEMAPALSLPLFLFEH